MQLNPEMYAAYQMRFDVQLRVSRMFSAQTVAEPRQDGFLRYSEDMKSQSTHVRTLSNVEKAALPASICADIELDLVEIHRRKWTPFTPYYVSVVRGNKVYYPNDPGPSGHPLHLAHLVHEVVHVWQYLHLGVSLFDPQWVYDRRYRYHLNDGDIFRSFGLEQQAAIAEDSFRIQNGLAYRWARNKPSTRLLDHTVSRCNAPVNLPIAWRA